LRTIDFTVTLYRSTVGASAVLSREMRESERGPKEPWAGTLYREDSDNRYPRIAGDTMAFLLAKAP
jgi:hypothetical protein